MWTQLEAIELCKAVEAMSPTYGYHVALTGGLLYKDGERKDCDLVLYRIRQVPEEQICWPDFASGLMTLGFDNFRHFGFCVKADYKGKPVDLLFPEPSVDLNGGGYPVEPPKKHDDPLVAALQVIEEIGQSL